MAGASAEASLLRSPRSNLRHLLTHPSSAHKAPDPSTLPPLDTVVDAALTDLIPADADAKLHRRKLYLVLDLDETLVYSQRMEAGATPKGTQIFVRGQAFDMITRPGLQYFLRSAHQNYVCYLYTMGDQDYTQAVLKVIDPTGKYFKGGVCCWRPSESRVTKTLLRPACERRMSLIVDDTVDVWANDLANLCITRRFVGDQLDDGLQLLSWQLEAAHRAFFADSPAEGYSYSPALAATPRAPPSVFSVLADARGQLLAGCSIALTGVVNGLGHEDGLEQVPLAVLIKLYGGALTTSLEHATHLVARRKDGWQNSPKIRKALARVQEGEPGFFAVWDHWLLDTLASWQKQNEAPYTIELEDERVDALTRQEQEERMEQEQRAPAPASEDADGMPSRKRARPDSAAAALGVNGAIAEPIVA